MDTYWSLSGPRRTMSRQLRYGTVQYLGPSNQLHQHRRDKRAGPQQVAAGWLGGAVICEM